MKLVQSLILLIILLLTHDILKGNQLFTPQDLLGTKRCREVAINPTGNWIAYTVQIPRTAVDESGEAYNELYVIKTKGNENKPLRAGKVKVSKPRWHPDGKKIAYLARGKSTKRNQIWLISVSDTTPSQLTDSPTSVTEFQWHPAGDKIIYIAETPESQKEKLLKEKGYGFVFYEENLKHKNLYMLDMATKNVNRLTDDITVWDFIINNSGTHLAFTGSPQNLIDHRYMFRKIYRLALQSGKYKQVSANEGKIGNYMFSPDGSQIVYAAALERKDHQVSQVFVIDAEGGQAINLTEPDFRGHVTWVAWKDNETILYRSGEGVWSTYRLVSNQGVRHDIMLNSQSEGIVFEKQDFTSDFEHFALIGSSPKIPGDIYYWQPGKEPKRLTMVNSWLEDRRLGRQEVIHYVARDGWQIEGILIYPVDYTENKKYPLIVYVHGGPEHHKYNGWLTRYSEPGQVMSANGYFVFYPNYRASTGYGTQFALAGYGDPAGKEFDDIADGIDYLIKQGMVDKEKVGLAGGSYGGYASAWFATYYTQYVRAVCMFVGISNRISSRGTTDIPYEELYVHSGKKLEDMWDFMLERSPIYWAHQSKTAVLIYGGTGDTRVDSQQSVEFYRRLKMNNHPAVRLVQYPGEKHGNRRQPGQIDVLFRQINWLDWYVKDLKPIDGPMPPIDLSEFYGLEFE